MAATKNSPKPPAAGKTLVGASKTKAANTKVSNDKVTKTPQRSDSKDASYRFSWSKKRDGAATIRIELDEASADLMRQAEIFAENVSPLTKAFHAKKGAKSTVKTGTSDNTTSLDNSTEPSTPRKKLFANKKRQSKGNAEDIEPDPYNSDVYVKEDSDDEDDSVYSFPITVDPLSPGKKPVLPDDPSVPKTTNPMERHKKRAAYPPDEHDPNGRKHGRVLVPWHRPRMLEKALLFLDYECHQNNIQIPWDAVVRRIQPGSSGAALTQHLEKMRLRLVQEGHMVPPDKHSPEIATGKWVRALVRSDPDPNSDPGKVRIVTWDEKVEHPTFNLETPGITNGSGKYRRGADGRQSASGSHRNEPRLKLEYSEEYNVKLQAAKDNLTGQKTKARRERAQVKRTKQRHVENQEWNERAKTGSPAQTGPPSKASKLPKARKLVKIEESESDSSDGEYTPGSKTPKPATRRSTRKGAGQKKKKNESEMDSSMMKFSSGSSVASQEVSTLPVKLSLSPTALSNFPAGQTEGSPHEALEVDEVEKENIEDDIADNESLDGDNADEAETAPGLEDSPSTVIENAAYAGNSNNVAGREESAEFDDDMSDIGQLQEQELVYDGQDVQTWLAQGELGDGHASNAFGFNPRPEDDVFGGNMGSSNVNTWLASRGPSTSEMTYSPSNPFNGPPEMTAFNVAHAIVTNQQIAAAQHQLAYGRDALFGSYQDPAGMHDIVGMGYSGGSVTPRHQDFFDDRDENAPTGGPQTPDSMPGYLGHGYGNSPYLQ